MNKSNIHFSGKHSSTNLISDLNIDCSHYNVYVVSPLFQMETIELIKELNKLFNPTIVALNDWFRFLEQLYQCCNQYFNV